MTGGWKAFLELGDGQLGGMELGDQALASPFCQALNTISARYPGIVHFSEACFSFRVAMFLGLWLMASEALKGEHL